MADLHFLEYLTDYSVSYDIAALPFLMRWFHPWKMIVIIILAYVVKVLIRQASLLWHHRFVGYAATPENLNYDRLITNLESLHSKIDKLQLVSDETIVTLETLKMKSDECQSELKKLKANIENLQVPSIAINKVSGGPPPPPPPPPPFSLVTPSVKIAPPTSVKSEMPAKKTNGPPQFSISQADITKVLQKLKKTNSTSRLLGSANSQTRKTPPRRKLFSRTPGQSRRRSIIALSPGGTFSRHRTPVSCASPPADVKSDVNGNGSDSQK